MRSPSQPPALAIEDLVKVYPSSGSGVKRLRMTVPQRGIHGFLGRNGAGKTTTMKLIMGLLHRERGSFSVLGERYDPDHDFHIRRAIGYAPELPTYPEHLTGRDALRLYAGLRGLSSSEAAQESAYLLRRLELSDVADQRIKTYSKGMQARFGVGIAMLGDPDLIILDEPTSGLDPVAMAELRRFLEELVSSPDRPRAILLSSHQLSEVQRLCTSVTIIDSGTTLAEGTVDELVRRISGGQVYLAEFNQLPDALAQETAALPGALSASRALGTGLALRLRMAVGADPREGLARIAQRHGALLLSCHREVVSIEDLFMAYVTGRGLDAATPEGARIAPAPAWSAPPDSRPLAPAVSPSVPVIPVPAPPPPSPVSTPEPVSPAHAPVPSTGPLLPAPPPARAEPSLPSRPEATASSTIPAPQAPPAPPVVPEPMESRSKFCMECGAKVPGRAKFCGSCGTRFPG